MSREFIVRRRLARQIGERAEDLMEAQEARRLRLSREGRAAAEKAHRLREEREAEEARLKAEAEARRKPKSFEASVLQFGDRMDRSLRRTVYRNVPVYTRAALHRRETRRATRIAQWG